MKGFFFIRDFVIHRAAAACVDFKTAKFFFGDFFADTALHHRRTGDKELARSPHHQREVRCDHSHRAESCHWAETRANHRHFAEHRSDGVPRRIRRHVGASDLFDGFDAAAATGSVHQPDHRDAQAARQFFAVPHFVADGAVVRAAADGEVVAANYYGPVVDFASARNKVRRSERAELAGVVIDSFSGERSDFMERVGIQQPRDSLSNRQPAGLVLPLDVRRTAHFTRDRFAPANFVDFGLPAHSVTLYVVYGNRRQ